MPIAKNRVIDCCAAKRTAELLVQADASDPCELRVVTVVPVSRPKYNFSHRSFHGLRRSSYLPTTCLPTYSPTLPAYMPTYSPTLT